MSDKVFQKAELREILLADPARREANDIPKNWFVMGDPGIDVKSLTVIPGQMVGDTATVLLTAREALDFFINFPVAVPSALDESSKELPIAGQRKPTTSRSRGVLSGLRDPNRTPVGHTDTIQLFPFGVTCDKNGIHFGKDSVAAVTDGAGRISAWFLDYNEQNGDYESHVAVQNEHVVQINFDLSANRMKCLKEFLLNNRDPKKTTRGTVQMVENSLIGHEEGKIGLDSVLWSTAVVSSLYKISKVSGTLLELFPWKMEGHQSRNPLFRGKGCSQSIGTALRSMQGTIRRSKLSVPKLAKVLDFAMTALYPSCSIALHDAHDAFEKRCHKSAYRLHSTLAAKMIIMLAVKLHAASKEDHKKFAVLVDAVMDTLYKNSKEFLFKPTKTKKMTLDKFFPESIFFDTNLFNSGAGNTRTLMPALERSCDLVLEKLDK